MYNISSTINDLNTVYPIIYLDLRMRNDCRTRICVKALSLTTMSSYGMMNQDLPPYGQPDGGYRQQPGPYVRQLTQTVPLRNSRENAASRDDADNDEVLGPGEIPDTVLNVCKHDNFSYITYLHPLSLSLSYS